MCAGCAKILHVRFAELISRIVVAENTDLVAELDKLRTDGFDLTRATAVEVRHGEAPDRWGTGVEPVNVVGAQTADLGQSFADDDFAAKERLGVRTDGCLYVGDSTKTLYGDSARCAPLADVELCHERIHAPTP